jgi:hypothetical protein
MSHTRQAAERTDEEAKQADDAEVKVDYSASEDEDKGDDAEGEAAGGAPGDDQQPTFEELAGMDLSSDGDDDDEADVAPVMYLQSPPTQGKRRCCKLPR